MTGSADPEIVTLDQLEIEPDPAEVLRYLGYPADAHPDPRIEAQVHSTLRSSRGRLCPRGVYAIHPVLSRTRRRLELSGGAAFSGPVGEFLAAARRVAVFVATAGPEVVRMADEALRSNDTLGGLVFNALGSHVAEAVVHRIAADLRTRIEPGEGLTLPYSPGYCGIPLTQQREVFRLVNASGIGVELLPSLIMKPIKSVSGLFGIGPASDVTAVGNPCDHCALVDCNMRR